MDQEDIVEEFKLQWLEGSIHCIQSIVDGASVAWRMLSTGKEEAAIGGTRTAVQDLRRWLAANPCPDALLADRLELIAGRYGFVVLAVEMGLETEDAVHLGTTIDRLYVLNDHTTQFLGELRKRLHGR